MVFFCSLTHLLTPALTSNVKTGAKVYVETPLFLSHFKYTFSFKNFKAIMDNSSDFHSFSCPYPPNKNETKSIDSKPFGSPYPPIPPHKKSKLN